MYTNDQKGATVYVTEALAENATTDKTKKVTEVGYYYFDGEIWQDYRLEPWYSDETKKKSGDLKEDIYHLGRVSVGGQHIDSEKYALRVFSPGNSNNTYGISNFALKANEKTTAGINSQVVDFYDKAQPDQQFYGINSLYSDNSSKNKGIIAGRFGYETGNGVNKEGDEHLGFYTGVLGDLSFKGSGLNKISEIIGSRGSIQLPNKLDLARFVAAVQGDIQLFSNTKNTGNNTYISGGDFHVSLSLDNGNNDVDIDRVNGVESKLNLDTNVGNNSSQQPSGLIKIKELTNLKATTNFDMLQYAGLTTDVENFYGLHVYTTAENKEALQGIKNVYGIYIDDHALINDNEKNFNLYSKGESSRNYFEGKVGMGTDAPQTKLHIIKNASELTPVIVEGLPTYATDTEADNALPEGGLYKDANGFLKVAN